MSEYLTLAGRPVTRQTVRITTYWTTETVPVEGPQMRQVRRCMATVLAGPGDAGPVLFRSWGYPTKQDALDEARRWVEANLPE